MGIFIQLLKLLECNITGNSIANDTADAKKLELFCLSFFNRKTIMYNGCDHSAVFKEQNDSHTYRLTLSVQTRMQDKD